MRVQFHLPTPITRERYLARVDAALTAIGVAHTPPPALEWDRMLAEVIHVGLLAGLTGDNISPPGLRDAVTPIVRASSRDASAHLKPAANYLLEGWGPLFSVDSIMGQLRDRVHQEVLLMGDTATLARLQQFKEERATKGGLEFVNADLYQWSSFYKRVAPDRPLDVESWYLDLPAMQAIRAHRAISEF